MKLTTMPIQWATPKWTNTPDPLPNTVPDGHIVKNLSDIDNLEKWTMANNYDKIYCIVDDVHDVSKYKNVLFGLSPNVILPKQLEKYRNE